MGRRNKISSDISHKTTQATLFLPKHSLEPASSDHPAPIPRCEQPHLPLVDRMPHFEKRIATDEQ
ncbi:hypothetical protein I7I50_10416 [Histoplasma capsulatum G186AR]|uniref:Uncharacterized protein n=1 Tax=Ajellomyces capsulatus TaxID=5037 RepID=A0A8H7Z6Q4_AJECA|nr:hypothetical protein I7I52_01655 [Histoplasma capsulatum]QSS69208.1 hypothetical protein I7I50_10416 [Histoplasma capsulatum G186AR]